MNEPRPASGPTNGRPWPGDRVRLKGTRHEGIVEDYEYGWNSHLFPVMFPSGYQMCSTTSVTTIRSKVRVIGADTTEPAPKLITAATDIPDATATEPGRQGVA